MVADVPVGVLLSGGIDSSVIVALLADAGQHGLQTFSIGFERVGDREGDEFEFSDLIAKEFDTDHHQLMMPSSTVLDGLDGAVEAMSEPMVSHDCIAFYLLSKAVSEHVTVVQSGQGADELLAGYDWYPPLAGHLPGAGARGVLGALLRPEPPDARRDPAAAVDDPGRSQPGFRPRPSGPPRRHRGTGQGAAAGFADHAGRRPGQAGRQHDDGLGPGGADPVPRPRVRRAGGRHARRN